MDAPDPPGGTASGQPPAPITPASGAGEAGAPTETGATSHSAAAGRDRQPRSSIWQSEGAKVAIIGAVATALAAAIFTSSRIDALLGWGGESPATASPATPPATSSIGTKAASAGGGAITVTVPADWGSAVAPYNMPIVGIVDAGAALRSGKGVGMISANSYDEPNSVIGASVDAAKRLRLPGRSREEYAAYLRQLLEKDDYTADGCTYGGQKTLDKPGYVAVVDTWAACRGFSDSEFRNMFAIADDGSHFVIGQVVTLGAERTSGERILSSFAIRPGAITSGPTTASADRRYPLPDWVTASTGDAVLP